VPGFRVRAVDTTGCGDAFLAALLFGIVRSGKRPEEIPEKELYEIARFANATGALTSLQYGAMTVPTSARVRQFLKDAG
jgi:fructokinase